MELEYTAGALRSEEAARATAEGRAAEERAALLADARRLRQQLALKDLVLSSFVPAREVSKVLCRRIQKPLAAPALQQFCEVARDAAGQAHEGCASCMATLTESRLQHMHASCCHVLRRTRWVEERIAWALTSLQASASRDAWCCMHGGPASCWARCA